MPISDGSSDVCSSDLNDTRRDLQPGREPFFRDHAIHAAAARRRHDIFLFDRRHAHAFIRRKGRASPAIGAQAQHRAHVRPSPVSVRSEEHTSELQSLMRSSYAVFCLNKKKTERIREQEHTNKSKKKKNN